MPAAEREPARRDEHEVTPLELFFDLVFVFAITQVTKLLTSEPTWGGLLRGMLVLAAVWWAWTTYAWLTSAIDVDEGAVRPLSGWDAAGRSHASTSPNGTG